MKTILFLALGCVGCSMAGVIMMQNPKTGAIYECRRGDSPFLALTANEDCARQLEQAGWKRLGGS